MAVSIQTIQTTVAPTNGVDEIVSLDITGDVAAGTFTLTFGGQTTSALAYNATAAQVQTALEALSTIGTGNVSCAGGPLPGDPIVITFIGDLSGTNPGDITSTDVMTNINEVQTITLTGVATGGTWTITYSGQTTSALAYDANAAAVQAALVALSNIDPGDVVVTGGPLMTGPFTLTFGGTLGSTDVAEVTVSAASLVGRNEVQTISITGTPTGGTFTVTYAGQTTGAIAYNADAATVDTALEALSNIEAADLTCGGGPLPDAAITVTFGGTLADTNVALMTTTDSLTGGTTPASAIAETTAGSDPALAPATGTAGVAVGTTGLTVTTSGVRGSYRGAAPGTTLISTTGVGFIYTNQGTTNKPTWTAA